MIQYITLQLTCLAVVLRGEHTTVEASTYAYAQLPTLLKDSNMVFFFLQALKMVSPDMKTGEWH